MSGNNPEAPKKKRQMDAAAAERMAELQGAMSQGAPESGASSLTIRRAMSFARMVGAGEMIEWGDKRYEVAPYPVIKHGEVREKISVSPFVTALLVLTTTVDKSSGEWDYDLAAKKLHGMLFRVKSDDTGKMVRDPDAEIDGEWLESFIVENAASVSQENAQAMADLAALTLQRRHPAIQADALLNDLDIPTFCRLLELIFLLNPGFISRF